MTAQMHDSARAKKQLLLKGQDESPRSRFVRVCLWLMLVVESTITLAIVAAVAFVTGALVMLALWDKRDRDFWDAGLVECRAKHGQKAVLVYDLAHRMMVCTRVIK